MEITIFTKMGGEINSQISTSISALQTGWVSGLLSLTTISITVYVMYYGYLVYAGKVQSPMPDIVWNLVRFAIVIGVLNNLSEYLTLITDAVNQLKGFLVSGGSELDGNGYTTIDKRIQKIVNLYIDVWKDASIWDDTLGLAILQSIFLIPLCLGTVGYSIGVIVAEVTLLALLAVFPLFLFCYLYGWFKDMFAMWIQALIGNCIFVLFLSVFSDVAFMVAEYAGSVVKSNGSGTSIVGCFLYLIAGSLVVASVKLAGQLSTALSKVAIDRVSQSMSTNAVGKGTIGRGLAMKGASKVTGGGADQVATNLNKIRRLGNKI